MQIPEYLLAVGAYWLELAGGCAVLTLVGLWERYRSRPISWRLYLGLVAVFVFAATFTAWKQKADALAATTDSLERTRRLLDRSEVETQRWRSVADDRDRANADLRRGLTALEAALHANPVDVHLTMSGGRTSVETSNRRNCRAKLSELLTEGSALKIKLEADDAFENDVKAWYARTQTYLDGSAPDASFGARFRRSPPVLKNMNSIDQHGRDMRVWIDGRIDALTRLVEELRD
jgi:hypothetical protein